MGYLSNNAIAHRKPAALACRSQRRLILSTPKVSVQPVSLTQAPKEVRRTYKQAAAWSGRRAGVTFDHYKISIAGSYGMNTAYYDQYGNKGQAHKRLCLYSRQCNEFSVENLAKPNNFLSSPTQSTAIVGGRMDELHLNFFNQIRRLQARLHWHALFYVTNSATGEGRWFNDCSNWPNNCINSLARGETVYQLYANTACNYFRQRFAAHVNSIEFTNENMDNTNITDPPTKWFGYLISNYSNPWYKWLADYGLYCRANWPEFKFNLNDAAHIGATNTSAPKFKNFRNDITLLTRLKNEYNFSPDTFGVQSHMFPNNFAGNYSSAKIQSDLGELSGLTNEIHITEIDWSNTSTGTPYDQRQRECAAVATPYMSELLQCAKIVQFIIWGFDDIQNWKNTNASTGEVNYDWVLMPFRFGSNGAANYTIQPMHYAFVYAWERARPCARNIAFIPGQTGNPYARRYVQVSNRRRVYHRF